MAGGFSLRGNVSDLMTDSGVKVVLVFLLLYRERNCLALLTLSSSWVWPVCAAGAWPTLQDCRTAGLLAGLEQRTHCQHVLPCAVVRQDSW